MRLFLKSVAITVGVILVGVILLSWRIDSFLDTAVALGPDGMVLEVESGAAFAVVSQRLGEQGVVSHPDWYRWYARLTGEASAIKAGEYRIKNGATPRSLLKQLVAGSVLQYSFTIVEGWSFKDLMAALERQPLIKHTVTRHDWPQIAMAIEATEEHPEGLFLPETYHYPKLTRDIDILRQAYQLLHAALAEEWLVRDSSLPLKNPYEALILASIVEKETARADERSRISGVFIRRLQNGMRLQTDPTVIYGVGDAFDGNLTRRHLQTDTPYNTYRRNGLPPTPIALAGKAAIRAALHPADGDEVYFVATGLPDGSHKFSATKDEHDAAVAEYLRRLRAARRALK